MKGTWETGPASEHTGVWGRTGPSDPRIWQAVLLGTRGSTVSSSFPQQLGKDKLGSQGGCVSQPCTVTLRVQLPLSEPQPLIYNIRGFSQKVLWVLIMLTQGRSKPSPAARPAHGPLLWPSVPHALRVCPLSLQLLTKPHPARTAAGKPAPGKDVPTPPSLPGRPQPFLHSLQALRPSQVTVRGECLALLCGSVFEWSPQWPALLRTSGAQTSVGLGV